MCWEESVSMWAIVLPLRICQTVTPHSRPLPLGRGDKRRLKEIHRIFLISFRRVVITRPLTWVCSNVLVPPVSCPEVAVSRDDIKDRSKPLENYNTTDDHLTSVIALSFTRWQHQHTQYIPQVAAPLPNRPNHHIPPGFIDITKSG